MTTLAQIPLGHKARNGTPFSDELPHFLELLEAEWRRTIRLRSWRVENLERQALLRDAHVALGQLLDRELEAGTQ
jgi:hypothetical protein